MKTGPNAFETSGFEIQGRMAGFPAKKNCKWETPAHTKSLFSREFCFLKLWLTPATALRISLYFPKIDRCILCIKRLPKFTIFYHDCPTNFAIFFCSRLTNFTLLSTTDWRISRFLVAYWQISWTKNMVFSLHSTKKFHDIFPLSTGKFCNFFLQSIDKFRIIFHDRLTNFTTSCDRLTKFMLFSTHPTKTFHDIFRRPTDKLCNFFLRSIE